MIWSSSATTMSRGKGPERETDPATTYTAQHAALRRRRAGDGRDAGARDVARAPDRSTRPPLERSGPPRRVYVEAVRRLAAAELVAARRPSRRSVELSERRAAQRSRNSVRASPTARLTPTHQTAKGRRRVRAAGRGRAAAGRAGARTGPPRRAGAGRRASDAAQRRCDRCARRNRAVHDRARGDQRGAAEHERPQSLDHPRQARHLSRARVRAAREASRLARGRRSRQDRHHAFAQGLGHRSRRQADRHLPDTHRRHRRRRFHDREPHDRECRRSGGTGAGAAGGRRPSDRPQQPRSRLAGHDLPQSRAALFRGTGTSPVTWTSSSVARRRSSNGVICTRGATGISLRRPRPPIGHPVSCSRTASSPAIPKCEPTWAARGASSHTSRS